MDDKKKDISQIKKYLNGELDARAMHKLEREAQDDPFLMDALDGFEQSADTFNFDDLDKRLADRIGESKVRKMFPWKYYAAAASVLLFFTVGYLMWPKPEAQKQQVADLVKPTAAQPDHTITPVDTNIVMAKEQAIVKARVAVTPHIKKAEGVIHQTDTVQHVAAQTKFTDPDSTKHLNELVAKLNNAPPMQNNAASQRVGAMPQTNRAYGNANAAVRVLGNSKPDSTVLHEISIPGVAKLNPNALAAKTAAQPQILDNKVKDAQVKTPKKGNDAMLSQLGLPLNTKLPNPTKKETAADADGRLAVPTKGQASSGAGIVASRTANDKTEETGKPESNTTSAGYEKAKPDNIKEAHPKMGWDAYNKYIKAKAIGGTGTVRLSFIVDAKGQLIDLKIVKSVDEATDKKAIELVKNGPAWSPDVSGKTKTIQLKVSFSKE